MRKHLKFTRRRFLSSLPAVAASIQIVPRRILGGQGTLSPNETPTKAVIGVGGMGRGHLKGVNPGSKLVAVCDVDKGHLKTALDQSGPDVKGYHDFRDVLSRKDVDIVHSHTSSLACAHLRCSSRSRQGHLVRKADDADDLRRRKSG